MKIRVKSELKTILSRIAILLSLITIGVVTASTVWAFWHFDDLVKEKLDSKAVLRSTEYYAAPIQFFAGMQMSSETLRNLLIEQKYRERTEFQRILPGDFLITSPSRCQEWTQFKPLENESHCFVFINKNVQNTEPYLIEGQFGYIESNLKISRTFHASNLSIESTLELEPRLIAEYRGDQPTKQREVTLSEIPPLCLQAVMAIEDDKFLEHSGVSYTGIFRAIVKNVIQGRRAQGGSTITQQLVKNYFLSSERSYRRKVQEIFMAMALESKFTKDQIFETYLNVIYMGQNGPFRVHGFAAAAEFYFGKELKDLGLSECALMAAILNGPSLYNPFKNFEITIKRRKLVLDRMVELKYITSEESAKAHKESLPPSTPILASETAPYYIDAVRKEMRQRGIPLEGKKIYTGLNLREQQDAQDALQDHLAYLEKNNKWIKGNIEKQVAKNSSKQNLLEGIVLSGDPRTGLVSVVVGGRGFRTSQFNRAIEGHRQIGSIMKPVVYLAALLSKDPEGSLYQPTSIIKDEPFTIKFDRQKWTPDNYSGKYYGEVPLFYALKNSLNAATAQLGLNIGFEKVVETARLLGVYSSMKALPSLTLGAFEMYPVEVLRMYMAFSQMGRLPELGFIKSVVDEKGQILYQFNQVLETVVDPATVASLVSMMKETIESGTARSVRLSGFDRPAAGKTGTTSDNKDAWFVGFTPYQTTVTWVGYDNNISHRLTGASGALPIWIHFMKKTAGKYAADDFKWPENTEPLELNEEELLKMHAIQSDEDRRRVILIRRKN